MAIKYKVVQKSKPGNPPEEKLYYAIPVLSGETSYEEIKEKANNLSTAHGADYEAVFGSMVPLCIQSLRKGEVARLGEFGSIRISFSSDGRKTEKEVKKSCIKNPRIIFNPGKAFKKMLKTLEFEKIDK
jgi:predicted histone-like DNA-binding protein